MISITFFIRSAEAIDEPPNFNSFILYPTLVLHKKKPTSFWEVGFKHLNNLIRLPTSGPRRHCGACAHKGNRMVVFYFHNLSKANLTQKIFFVNRLKRKSEYYSYRV